MQKGGILLAIVLLSSGLAVAQILDSNELSKSVEYDELLDVLFSNDKVVTNVGNKLWVPWYSSSSSCELEDLHSGKSCNAGSIDSEHNCMVTDEFSQVGILVAMGKNQDRMDQFLNTVLAIQSDNGRIPAWRVYRDGDKIEACKDGINSNCDTASDATARIIIALFTASDNPYFLNEEQKALYKELARQLSADFLEYEVVNVCKPSGFGDICYWLAAGADAKKGGLASTDFGYTGYYGDAIIAMLQACGQTGESEYCDAARDFSLNYLQAAKWDGSKVSMPPGRSFRWVEVDGEPQAECTNTCKPDQWDDADAPRALGMCQANHYASQIGVSLPELQEYCSQWGSRYMNIPNGAPLQYFPDGFISERYQNGYFAQGLQALFQAGGHDPSLFKPTLESALEHWTPRTQTWDYEACFGVYKQAFALRALGFGIGRDEGSFPAVGTRTVPEETPVVEVDNTDTGAETVEKPEVSIATGDENLAITVKDWFPKGTSFVFVCESSGFTPTSYDWYFGDGDKQVFSDNRDVWHTFEAGDYRVRCVARDDARTFSTSIDVTATG